MIVRLAVGSLVISLVVSGKRDRTMAEPAREFPGYGWETNAGYGTKQHQQGLAELGVTPHHRGSFALTAKLIK